MAKTVSLARKLGLVETISSTACKSESKCDFTHVIVVDFESTCWSDRRFPPEVIEFPAILMNLSNGEILSEFHQYVTPIENPVLSEFCKNFTGISQRQVDDGVPLKTCLLLFQKWYSNVLHHCKAASLPLLTWSDWDFGVCLHQECMRKAIKKPDVFNSWIDLRALFRTHTKKPSRGLRSAMGDVGLTFEGREHSGIIDARNTARLAWKLHTEGICLKITKTLT